jgi:Holliday junction DNA helicase RuvA
MYSYLSGKLAKITDSTVVIDVNGIGFEVHVPLRTLANLPKTGSAFILYTYLHVREDAQVLFGFQHEEERELFKMLLGVTGIGPKIAIAILSGIGPRDLKASIESKDEDFLASIPGIGKKTASRLILELREKIQKLSLSSPEEKHSTDITRDGLMALLALGFTRPQAQSAIEKVVKESGRQVDLEELIKGSIKVLNQKRA